MNDPLIELLEDAFGAGFDHAKNGIWGWVEDFNQFLGYFSEEIKAVRENL